MTSRVKTSFKRMFLVDEKLYNKLTKLPASNYNNTNMTTSPPTNAEMNSDVNDNSVADNNQSVIDSDFMAHEDDIVVAPPTSTSTDNNSIEDTPAMEGTIGNSLINLSHTPNTNRPLTVTYPMAQTKIVDLKNKKKRPVTTTDNLPEPMIQSPQYASVEQQNLIDDDDVISQSETCKSNCKLCGQEFSTEGVVRAHYKDFHPMKPVVIAASSKSDSRSKAATGSAAREKTDDSVAREITRNECKVCNIFFPSTAALNKHIQDTHEKTPNGNSFDDDNKDDDSDEDMKNIGLDDDDDDNNDTDDGNSDIEGVENSYYSTAAAAPPPSTDQNKTLKRKRNEGNSYDENDDDDVDNTSKGRPELEPASKKYRKSFKCNICQTTYRTENALKRHNNNIHKYLVDDSSSGRRRSKRKLYSIEGGGNDELEDIIVRKQKKRF